MIGILFIIIALATLIIMTHVNQSNLHIVKKLLINVSIPVILSYLIFSFIDKYTDIFIDL